MTRAPDFSRPRRIYFLDAEPESCLERILAGGRSITYFEAGYRDVNGPGDQMSEADSACRRKDDHRKEALLAHLRRSRQLYLECARCYDQVVVVDNSRGLDATVETVCADLAQTIADPLRSSTN